MLHAIELLRSHSTLLIPFSFVHIYLASVSRVQSTDAANMSAQIQQQQRGSLPAQQRVQHRRVAPRACAHPSSRIQPCFASSPSPSQQQQQQRTASCAPAQWSRARQACGVRCSSASTAQAATQQQQPYKSVAAGEIGREVRCCAASAAH